MSDPYVGEIRMFAGTFAPVGWALCQGQLVPISENETLFQLIGTTYGGDGQQTFALPNLNSRFPVSTGTGPGGTSFPIAQTGGSPVVTLVSSELPSHSHPVTAGSGATTSSANGAYPGAWADSPYTTATPDTALASQQIGSQGGVQSHENRQPYLAMNFIISLFGTFPSRT